MELRYHSVDVFTATRFGGNPLAVVHDADALSDAQMLAITREFNYSETTFLCRPADPRHTARVRIFTPGGEVPFAGHPNIGTAFVLAHEPAHAAAEGFLFEEAAGLVPVSLIRDCGLVTATRLTAPEPLSTGEDADPAATAAALSLAAADIVTKTHAPRMASVGLPFRVVEIGTRAALALARPDLSRWPKGAGRMVWLYTRDLRPADGEVDLSARMFAPDDGMMEDPATGSATAAACAMLSALTGRTAFRVAQGVDMGRPSLLSVTVDGQGVHLAGQSVPVMSGVLTV